VRVCVCARGRAALRAGPDAGQVDAPRAAHHPVLPGRVLLLRGLHARVRLQAPLERRGGGAPAGGAHRRAHRECNRLVLNGIPFPVCKVPG